MRPSSTLLAYAFLRFSSSSSAHFGKHFWTKKLDTLLKQYICAYKIRLRLKLVCKIGSFTATLIFTDTTMKK